MCRSNGTEKHGNRVPAILCNERTRFYGEHRAALRWAARMSFPYVYLMTRVEIETAGGNSVMKGSKGNAPGEQSIATGHL